MLQRLCFLAKQLEKSKHYALNAIRPGLIESDKKFVSLATYQFARKEEDHVNEKALKEILSELKVLSDYLHCNPLQVAIFSAIFSQSSTNRSCDLDDICRFFDIDNIDAQLLQHDFELLQKTNLLELDDPRKEIDLYHP
jgi:hypothetical protein